MALFYLPHTSSWHNFGFWNTLSKQLRKKKRQTRNQPSHTPFCSFHYKMLQNMSRYRVTLPQLSWYRPILPFVFFFFSPPLFIPITKGIFTKSCHKWCKFTEVISSSLECWLGSSGTSNPSFQFIKTQEWF